MRLLIEHVTNAGRGSRGLGKLLAFLVLLTCTVAANAAGAPKTAATPACPDGTRITIPARCPAHKTGFKVRKGARYKVSVVDMRGVYDLFVPVRDLQGWPWAWVKALAKPLEKRRRQPRENWFAVIATVDGAHPRVLSATIPYVAPATGEMVCYFNDDPRAYWNNFGTAHLCLSRLR
jgi:hypothetical protein